MIVLHKLNGSEFVLNDQHIETIEETPDTVITLTNERKYLVKESADEVIQRIVEYKRKAHD
jgi:flagellar protein FlbD